MNRWKSYLNSNLEKNVSNIKKWTGGGTNFLQTTISDTVLLAKDLSATSTIPHTVLVTFQMAGYVLVYLVVFGSKSNFCQYTQVFSMTSDTSHAFTVKYFSFDSTERVLKATVGTEQKYINYRVTFLSGLYSNIEYIWLF